MRKTLTKKLATGTALVILLTTGCTYGHRNPQRGYSMESPIKIEQEKNNRYGKYQQNNSRHQSQFSNFIFNAGTLLFFLLK